MSRKYGEGRKLKVCRLAGCENAKDNLPTLGAEDSRYYFLWQEIIFCRKAKRAEMV